MVINSEYEEMSLPAALGARNILSSKTADQEASVQRP